MTLQRKLDKISIIYILSFAVFIHSGNSFILFPEEFTTLGNTIWSLLPPIRSGVSSKVGFGFRLGRNADFQVVFEIGPQMNNTNTTNTSKRDLPINNEIAPIVPLKKKRNKFPKTINKLST